MDSVYYDLERIDEIIAQEGHRDIIGGRWEELGNLQLMFMKKAGLQPHHKLLDVGCGSLRAGVKFVEYLNPGNYFGIDISEGLLNVGYHIELTKSGLTHRLPKENLVCAADFESGAPEGFFDFVIAQSLFTHLMLPNIGMCLRKSARVVRAGGTFYASILRVDDKAQGTPYLHEKSGITSYPSSDPYHQAFPSLQGVAAPFWAADLVGDWGHPGGNEMAAFVRL